MINVQVASATELDMTEVLDLYSSVGWTAYTGDPALLATALQGSSLIVIARHQGRLAALARVLSDGATIVYFQDILVRPEYQRHGYGQALVSAVRDHFPGIRQQALLTDDDAAQKRFYESLGFRQVSAHDGEAQLRAFVKLS